jgi:hypothetical protein
MSAPRCSDGCRHVDVAIDDEPCKSCEVVAELDKNGNFSRLIFTKYEAKTEVNQP